MGFVSNSSSSSFLVVSKSSNINDTSENLRITMDGCDGKIIFKPTKEMMDYLKANPEVLAKSSISFSNVYLKKEDAYVSIKELKGLPDDCYAEGIMVDQNSPRTLDEFKKCYLNEED